MKYEEMWLLREEIASMCRAKTKRLQVKFLRDNGIKHYIDRRGWPVVARSVAENVELKAAAASASPAGWKPNKAA